MEGTVGVYQQLQAVGVKASMSLISTSDLDLMSEMIGLCGQFQSKENLHGLFHLLYCCHIFLPLGTKNQIWLMILLNLLMFLGRKLEPPTLSLFNSTWWCTMSFAPPCNLFTLSYIISGTVTTWNWYRRDTRKSPTPSMVLIGQKIDQEVQNDIGVSIFVWIPMSGIGCTYELRVYPSICRHILCIWQVVSISKTKCQGLTVPNSDCWTSRGATLISFVLLKPGTWKKSAYHWFRPASALWNRRVLEGVLPIFWG